MVIGPVPPIYNPEENRDLGFGTVVSTESHVRLLNRDGSFNVKRKGLGFWESISFYHALLTMAWWKFLALITLGYFGANAIFAAIYVWCGPGALQPSPTPGTGPGTTAATAGFMDAFFFSVQTLSTIGYGNRVPVGLPANLVVSLESLLGLLGFALATGIMFARFSRPTASILYSRNAVVAPYKGITAFEFRVINARSNQIIELEAKLIFTRFEAVNGSNLRRYYSLPLERGKVAFFPLTWTIVHPIDEESPLRGLSHEDLIASSSEFLILLTGIDETFSDTVHSRSSYKAEEVVWNAKFINMFSKSDGGELLSVNLQKFHGIERVS